MDELAFSVMFDPIPVGPEEPLLTTASPPSAPRSPPADGKDHRPHRDAPAEVVATRANVAFGKGCRVAPHPVHRSPDKAKSRHVGYGPTVEEVQRELAEDELRIAMMRQHYPTTQDGQHVQLTPRTEVAPCSFLGSEDVTSSFYLVKVGPDRYPSKQCDSHVTHVPTTPRKIVESPFQGRYAQVTIVNTKTEHAVHAKRKAPVKVTSPKRDSLDDDACFDSHNDLDDGLFEEGSFMVVTRNKGKEGEHEGTITKALHLDGSSPNVVSSCENSISTQIVWANATTTITALDNESHSDCDVKSPSSVSSIPVRQVQMLRALGEGARHSRLSPPDEKETSFLTLDEHSSLFPPPPERDHRAHDDVQTACAACPTQRNGHQGTEEKKRFSITGAMNLSTFDAKPESHATPDKKMMNGKDASPEGSLKSPSCGVVSPTIGKGLISSRRGSAQVSSLYASTSSLLHISSQHDASVSQHHFHVVRGAPAPVPSVEAQQLHQQHQDEAATMAHALHDHLYSSQKAARSSVLVIQPTTLVSAHRKHMIRIYEEDEANESCVV